MNSLSRLSRGDRAVSPVVAIILMTGITVILASIIGTFVLGLGDRVTGSNSPQANFDFEARDIDSDGTVEQVVIMHNGGDTVNGGQLKIRGSVNIDQPFGTNNVVTGDTVVLGENGDAATGTTDWNGMVLRVVWVSDGGKTSDLLGEFTVPS